MSHGLASVLPAGCLLHTPHTTQQTLEARCDQGHRSERAPICAPNVCRSLTNSTAAPLCRTVQAHRGDLGPALQHRQHHRQRDQGQRGGNRNAGRDFVLPTS
jgi:hypothetical protein